METNVTSVLPIAHDWAKEYAELSAWDAEVAPEDLERGAIAAKVLGNDEQAVSLLDRAHRSYLEQGLPDRQCAVSDGGSAAYRSLEMLMISHHQCLVETGPSPADVNIPRCVGCSRCTRRACHVQREHARYSSR